MVGAYDWRSVGDTRLVEQHHWSQVLEIEAKAVGGSARLLSGLLIRGIAEGRGLVPFIVAAYFFEILPLARAELARRGAAHPAGTAAVGVAVAIQLGLTDAPQVEHAVEEVRRRIRLPSSIRRRRDQIEPRGQIPLTITKDIDANDPLGALVMALEGKLDQVPDSVVRDLQNEAEMYRRQEGRGVGEGSGGHAQGEARLLVGLELAVPSSAKDPHAEDRRPGDVLEVGAWGERAPAPLEILLSIEGDPDESGADPAVVAVRRVEDEYGRLRALAEQHPSRLQRAPEHDAQGVARSAPRVFQ